MQGSNLFLRMFNFQFLVLLTIAISKTNAAILSQDYLRRKPNQVGPEGRLSIAEWDSYNLHEPEGPGTYAFGYDIDDAKTGNTQFREEERHPDGSVTGKYGYVEPDGNVHIVYYTADEKGYRVRIENSRSKGLQKNSIEHATKINNNDNKLITNPFIGTVKNPQPSNIPNENIFHHSTSVPVVQRPSVINNIEIPLYQSYNKPSIEIAPPYQSNYGSNTLHNQKPYSDLPIQRIQAQYVVPFQQKVITSQYNNNYPSPTVYNNIPKIYSSSSQLKNRKNNNALSYNRYFVPNTQYLNLIR